MVGSPFRQNFEGFVVSSLKFEVLSTSSVDKLSVLECQNSGLFSINSGKKVPILGGVLDQKLGVSSSQFTCTTCNKDIAECPGHFGSIPLELPCFNVGYIPLLIKILQILCKNCSEPLLSKELQAKFLKILQNKHLTAGQRKAAFYQVNTEAKKVRICGNCGSYNGPVKKIQGLKIFHEYYKVNSASRKLAELTKTNISELTNNTYFAQQALPELKPNLNRILEIITPQKVLDIFRKVKREIYPLLGISRRNLPEDVIIKIMVVPPACIRPSVVSDVQVGSNEDDLTVMLDNIICANKSIADHRRNGTDSTFMLEDWDYLQSYAALFVNGEVTNLPPHLTDASINRGCMQRLKGKYGRFRGNLSGKRVDFSGRTVISPDPNLKIGQVAVPVLMAKVMTYPERVSHANINKLRKLVIAGADVHPGANYVITRKAANRIFLKFGKRELIAKNLRYGDIVERHMETGDVVLFNRQPSLHRLSIMAHTAVIMPNRTLRFNECSCTPFNADFDGDEMNIHLPQTEEARAEAFTLLNIRNNIITPRNGEPLVSPTQDFITGAHVITKKDIFFTQFEFMHLLSSILVGEDATKRIFLPKPALYKPYKLWTGKQLITAIVNPFVGNRIWLNIRTKTKSYSTDEDLCLNDGYCVFFNGEHMCGSLDKSIIGSGSKATMIYAVLREYGTDECCKIMWRIARITPLYLMNTGFSIGIQDVTPSVRLLDHLNELVERGYSKCNEFIKDCETGRLTVQPGCTFEETLEAYILRELSTIRDSAGKFCLKELHETNSPLIMAISGSKGSFINISQMVACVGQQALNGKRTPDGFESRTLPHFRKNQKTADAKGFVRNSFFSGMSPTEFYFHTMAGREGLVDTAVKTAETGYMQRRLVKCLEDLCVQYDTTVRSSANQVVQFIYGEDGLDPIEMEGDSRAVNFEFTYNHILNNFSSTTRHEASLTGAEIIDITEVALADAGKEISQLSVETIKNFVAGKAKLVSEYFNQLLDCKYTIDETYHQKAQRLTKTQLLSFLQICVKKYAKSQMESGTAVGALCAQSIGEPGTQMTLKTFHFAGVATMNITLGVPRLKEIINASANISTPIITAPLEIDDSIEFARLVKARLEKTTLSDICEFIEEVYLPEACYIILKIDLNRIKLLKLEVDEASICQSISSDKKMKIRPTQVCVLGKGHIAVTPDAQPKSSKYFVIQQLKVLITNVVIKGHKSVNKAIIHAEESGGKGRYKLLIEGADLRPVMSTRGIIGEKVTTNHTHATFQALGIEAARTTIINEIIYTMSNHGMSIDRRHVMLLADLMTYKGEVLGITRYGLNKMKDSVLMLASFEKTADHLFDAAFYGATDDVTGVTESIILGRPMKLGTGIFKVLFKPQNSIETKRRPKTTVFEHVFSK